MALANIKDPLLRSANIQWGEPRFSPLQGPSFPLHCAVMDHYFSGGLSHGRAGRSAIGKVDDKDRTEEWVETITTGTAVKSILFGGKEERSEKKTLE